MANPRTLTDTVCLGCACLCDDIRLTIDQDRVAAAENTCDLGEAWFKQPVVPSEQACTVAGQPATFDAAVAEAARLLSKSQRPFFTGLAGVSTDAQRQAIAIADRLGGVVSSGNLAAAKAMATHGAVSATLGEAAQRADVVIFWRCDPATSHPRHFERYSLAPSSDWLPRGRADRMVIAVGDPETTTTIDADVELPLPAGRDAEAFAVLRALHRGLPLDATMVAATTGTPLDAWRSLAKTIADGKYVALFFEGLNGLGGLDGHAAHGALTGWLTDLQTTTRCAALPLGGGAGAANAAGAANVLAWQTGYEGVVDFSRGYPRPMDYEPADADAVLNLSPEVTLSMNESETAAVAFRVAPPGFATRGSAYRCDGVALPLRSPWAPDGLAAETVLAAIEWEL